MHPPPRAARPARPPPPLQHPIPTHPRFQVPESPVRSDFSADDGAAYAPASHYTPQAGAAAASTQHAYAPAPAAQRAPPKKRETYTRISSPRGSTPVAGHAAQQRTAHPGAPQPRPRSHASPAQARSAHPYAPPSRSNSAASVVPNMHMYQPASVPGVDGTAGPDNYPHTPTYAAATPPHDPYARSADAWGFGAQPTGTPGPNMPSLGAGMMNDATAQMGMQFGRHVAQVGGEYMQRNVRTFDSPPSSAPCSRCRCSSTTSTCPTRTCCTSCASLCSRGGTSPGRAACATRRRTVRRASCHRARAHRRRRTRA